MKIKIIIGSIRDNRFGDKPGKWIHELAQGMGDKAHGSEFSILDLKDFELPLFKEGTSPSQHEGTHSNPDVEKWAEEIRTSDGFVVVTPEYNHGYSSALKNNIDYLYKEWHKKAVGFVAYGSVGGARAVEQLRQVAIELHMAPVRNAVHIFEPWMLVDEKGDLKQGALDSYRKAGEAMLSDLVWWTGALKEARAR